MMSWFWCFPAARWPVFAVLATCSPDENCAHSSRKMSQLNSCPNLPGCCLPAVAEAAVEAVTADDDVYVPDV